MNIFKKTIISVIAVIVVAAVIFGITYLRYAAYKQQFPNAEPWTFIFR